MPTYKTSEAEGRAAFREKVAAHARGGRRPSTRFDAESLAWAFDGTEDELAELEQLAAQAVHERAAKDQSARQSRDLRALADRIESDMIAAEKAERRARAEAEARRRLGLEGA